jgi:RNA polymerase sigma-70 factor (ECF subfamily)
LFTACYPRLAGWVRRLVDDDDAAHEIASEAFTRLLARWHRLVRALIQALPASMRSAFLLHYYAGFALREVAVMLGRAEGTVKSDLSQARARLRAAVGQHRA